MSTGDLRSVRVMMRLVSVLCVGVDIFLPTLRGRGRGRGKREAQPSITMSGRLNMYIKVIRISSGDHRDIRESECVEDNCAECVVACCL